MLKQGVNGNGEPLRDFRVEHDPVVAMSADDGLTRQEFADECDINVLMATYERTGAISHLNRAEPQYLDVTDVPDLAGALDYMHQAETAFMTLPASVRKEFDNNAVNFVEFASNPENVSKMREWGLAAPAPVADAFIPPEGTSPPPPDKAPPTSS